ncbi:MAG: hypothetical protein AAB815_00760 [Patescibacteria group bacterium]
MQHYDQCWQQKGDQHIRYHCDRCGCLLPEGATEDDEICASCEEETIGNNAEPIKNYPEDDWREDR